MPTVLDTLTKGADYLAKHGVEDARLNMEHLIAWVLKCDRMQVYVQFDQELVEPKISQLRELTMRRSKGEPLQHLLGSVEFCGLEFKTDDRALIPRPETEELTDRCSKLTLPSPLRVLDMGCGSGVIGLSLAHLLADKNPSIVLVDLSSEALALAEENRQALVPEADIHLIESDLFSNVEGVFDLIVANLPYIPKGDQTTLSREVQRDPSLALYGGEVGTELIERFFQELAPHIESGGRIALEYGIHQEESIATLAASAKFESIEIISDLSGVNRFLLAVKI